jgi:hypothetical protein
MERIENGVAFIYGWTAIESRLSLAAETDCSAHATIYLSDGGGATAGGRLGESRTDHA